MSSGIESSYSDSDILVLDGEEEKEEEHKKKKIENGEISLIMTVDEIETDDDVIETDVDDDDGDIDDIDDVTILTAKPPPGIEVLSNDDDDDDDILVATVKKRKTGSNRSDRSGNKRSNESGNPERRKRGRPFKVPTKRGRYERKPKEKPVEDGAIIERNGNGSTANIKKPIERNGSGSTAINKKRPIKKPRGRSAGKMSKKAWEEMFDEAPPADYTPYDKAPPAEYTPFDDELRRCDDVVELPGWSTVESTMASARSDFKPVLFSVDASSNGDEGRHADDSPPTRPPPQLVEDFVDDYLDSNVGSRKKLIVEQSNFM